MGPKLLTEKLTRLILSGQIAVSDRLFSSFAKFTIASGASVLASRYCLTFLIIILDKTVVLDNDRFASAEVSGVTLLNTNKF